MRNYFAYIRVSTIRQGERGSSLAEQRDAIIRYAQKHGLSIGEWFEEQESAAKRGRTQFRKLLTRLKRGHAHGIIIHKVDRSARNLADWAELASLMDLGIDVHFAHEALDLTSRGGRLSADIQAVVAADYIRNLRQEVKKGMYGRLKQGILPYAAPPGYLNHGTGGQQKTIDPIQGPLVREAFERYATGKYTYHSLVALMTKRGLRNSAGKPFRASGICKLFRNTYYYGIITTKGQTFAGSHVPLISKAAFDRCQAQRVARVAPRSTPNGKAEYALRRLIVCATCNRSLVPERQKGVVYYRCHTKSCPTTCLRETAIISRLQEALKCLPSTACFDATIRRLYLGHLSASKGRLSRELAVLALRKSQIVARQERLTTLFIDDAIDRQTYDAQKLATQNDLIELAEQELRLQQPETHGSTRLERLLELAKRLRTLPEMENPVDQRESIKAAVSNLRGREKTIDIQWSDAFLALFSLGGIPSCGGERNNSRTDGVVWQCSDPNVDLRLEPVNDQPGIWFDAILADDNLDVAIPAQCNDNQQLRMAA